MGIGANEHRPHRDGEARRVVARAETWHLTFWRDGASRRGEPASDAVSVEVERHDHNFPASLTAKEAAAIIDALLELLPEAHGHMTAKRLVRTHPAERKP